MKPLISETEDSAALSELGRASVQVVHDLKNQINGLKLYATFLRKRFEKAERPPDELETIGKLIAGLERAATDTAALVRYGRPLELRRAPRTDLARIVAAAAQAAEASGTAAGTTSATTQAAPVEISDGAYTGDFDPALLTEALKNITVAARAPVSNAARASEGGTMSGGAASGVSATGGEVGTMRLRREADAAAGAAFAIIEWNGVAPAATAGSGDGGVDVFRSFAGVHGMRLALAAKIIRAHGGDATQEADRIRVRLPLDNSEVGG